jgi:DNA-binding beta-propeller fold protein YncE
MQVVATIPVGMLPTAMVSNESTGRLYLANASTDSIYVIEGSKIVKEIGVGRHPVDLARDEASNRILVANEGDRTVSIIDEADLAVRSTDAITRFVSTVAVDDARGRVYVNDVVLDLKTLKPVNQLLLRPYMVYQPSIPPDWVRVHPGSKRVYLVAWNGTPGSNSRSVVYSVNGETLEATGVLANYGNTTALAFDRDRNRTFLAATHPLAYTNDFAVFDEKDNRLAEMEMPSRTISMIYNPQTHHLFMSHMDSVARSYGPTPVPANDTLEVLDGDTLGRVSVISIKTPGLLGSVGNTIYVTSRENGTVTLVQDVNTGAAPSPTPTRTPSPYPTGTGTPAVKKPTATITIAAQPTKMSCAINPPPGVAQKITPQNASRLGCALEPAKDINFAVQQLQNAEMFWKEDEKKIYVLYNDKTWAAYDDTWESSQPVDSCPNVTVPAGALKPIRGFGKIWCTTPGVRAKAGDAVTGEFGLYPATTEKFERGRIFGGPVGQLFALFSDARWE